jgi:hypothetical protein
MGRDFFAYLTAIILGLLTAPISWGYPTPVDFDGRVMRWPLDMENGIVTYEVVAEEASDLDQYADLVEEAASIWSHAGGSYVSYQKVPEGEAPKVTVNLVRALKDAAYASGYTTFDAYDERGRPVHCEIYIHISENYSYNGIAKTILHELGHGLGLGHTLIPEAIMSYSLGQNQFALDTDDQAAIARLYPPDGSKPHLAPGCAVGSADWATEPSARRMGQIFLLALPLIIGLISGIHPISSIRSMDRFARSRISSGT